MRRFFTGRTETILPILALFLSAVGVLNTYSATFYARGGGFPIYLKQVVWVGLGFFLALGISWLNESLLEDISLPVYVITLLLLLLVLVAGKTTGGARRWISLGPVSIQPSELGKVAIILFLGRYFARSYNPYGITLRDLVVPFAFVLVPFFLIILQPDLGTGGLYILIFAGMAYLASLRTRSIATLFLAGLVSLPVVWNLMRDYQKKRVLTFLSPERDPFGAGYHVIQSKIAIGSGGLFGKGFLQGTQGQLRFLPEQHTDFAFSVFAEEWGFFVCLVFLILFLLFILRIFFLARQVQDRFSALVIGGIGVYFLLQFSINLAMVMGLFPVVGVPLPFVSYGGSSMLTSMLAVGVVMNQSKRRFLL
ncbi:MAG: rod shape-determining protein RodA [Deltaproteobacteria bacterium]|nr:MAG: rod shape-determining protein RodA [Deltaproteobacteria bacterium]